MNKTSKLELMSCIVVIGFFAAVIFHYIVGAYLHHPYPMNTFLCEATRDIAFTDFRVIYMQTQQWHPYAFPEAMYFPFAYIPFGILGVLPEKLAFLVFTIISLGFFLYFAYYFFQNNYFEKNVFANKFTNIKNIFILSFLTYPFLFCLERGNSEWLVFAFMGLFLVCYIQKKFYWSALFLACATAMKGYAGIFVFLFLMDKHYKEVLLVCVVSALLTLVSLLLLKGSIVEQLTALHNSLNWFQVFYIKNDRALCFDATLYSLSKASMHAIHHIRWSNTEETSSARLVLYAICACAAFAVVLVYLFFVETFFWKKVATLAICGQILPFISLDYHLIHIYLAIFVFVAAIEAERSSYDKWYAILFALFLIPKNYHMLYGSYGTSSFLNTLILLAILLLMMGEGGLRRSKH